MIQPVNPIGLFVSGSEAKDGWPADTGTGAIVFPSQHILLSLLGLPRRTQPSICSAKSKALVPGS
jgi:hypothetical protein